MRMWGKLWKDHHLLKDTVAEDFSGDTRTHKVFSCLRMICMEFDLEVPQWLSVNISEFQKTAKAKFTKDNFIEETDFDCLEIQVIEE